MKIPPEMLDRLVRAKAETLLLDEDPLGKCYGRLLATDVWQKLHAWFEAEAVDDESLKRAVASLIQFYGFALAPAFNVIIPDTEKLFGESLKVMFDQVMDDTVKDKSDWLKRIRELQK